MLTRAIAIHTATDPCLDASMCDLLSITGLPYPLKLGTHPHTHQIWRISEHLGLEGVTLEVVEQVACQTSSHSMSCGQHWHL